MNVGNPDRAISSGREEPRFESCRSSSLAGVRPGSRAVTAKISDHPLLMATLRVEASEAEFASKVEAAPADTGKADTVFTAATDAVELTAESQADRLVPEVEPKPVSQLTSANLEGTALSATRPPTPLAANASMISRAVFFGRTSRIDASRPRRSRSDPLQAASGAACVRRGPQCTDIIALSCPSGLRWRRSGPGGSGIAAAGRRASWGFCVAASCRMAHAASRAAVEADGASEWLLAQLCGAVIVDDHRRAAAHSGH